MKNIQQCPVCFNEMTFQKVSPCMDCGDDPKEITDLLKNSHTYSEFEVSPGLRLILCNFCEADFSSYDPTYFGLPLGTKMGIGKMIFIRNIEDPKIIKDFVCPTCNHRLAFLDFMVRFRENNKGR